MRFSILVLALAMVIVMAGATSVYIKSETKITNGSMYSNRHSGGSEETFSAYGDITKSDTVQSDSSGENTSSTTLVSTTPGMEHLSVLIQNGKSGGTHAKTWWSNYKNLQSDTLIESKPGSLVASYDEQGEGNLWILALIEGNGKKPDTITEYLTGRFEISRLFQVNHTVVNASDQEWLPCTSCEAETQNSDTFQADTWIRQGQSPTGGIFQEVGRNLSSTGSTVPGAYPYYNWTS